MKQLAETAIEKLKSAPVAVAVPAKFEDFSGKVSRFFETTVVKRIEKIKAENAVLDLELIKSHLTSKIRRDIHNGFIQFLRRIAVNVFHKNSEFKNSSYHDWVTTGHWSGNEILETLEAIAFSVVPEFLILHKDQLVQLRWDLAAVKSGAESGEVSSKEVAAAAFPVFEASLQNQHYQALLVRFTQAMEQTAASAEKRGWYQDIQIGTGTRNPERDRFSKRLRLLMDDFHLALEKSMNSFQSKTFVLPAGQKMRPEETTCAKSAMEASYCVNRSLVDANPDRVIYFFHEFGESVDRWNDPEHYSQAIRRYWQLQGLKAPTVVTISFGKLWLLAQRGMLKAPQESERQGFLTALFEQVIPEIEAKIGTPKERVLFGASMGGVNALIAMTQRPGVFQKVAAVSAPLYGEIDPFTFEANDYTPIRSRIFSNLAKRTFGTQSNWFAIDPFHKMRTAFGAAHAKTQLYLGVSTNDMIDPVEGTRELKELAEKKMKVELHEVAGPHNTVDISSLASFLAK